MVVMFVVMMGAITKSTFSLIMVVACHHGVCIAVMVYNTIIVRMRTDIADVVVCH
jgi:hypothetical protein